MKSSDSLLDRFLAGEVSAAARMITLAESGDPSWEKYFDRIASKVGRAFRTGFTGPPGAGKSTTIDACAAALRARKRTVGIVAVDPTSPFSGGALLGDRVRMHRVQLDEGVFIRSMATRGSLGGIALATVDAADVLDAFGFEEILIETVGVGQAETDILSAADTVVVVLCPGAGDGIQAMKAGLMEIADVFLINKADLPGADKLRNEIEDALNLRKDRGEKDGWRPPLIDAVAAQGRGVEELLTAVEKHRDYLRRGAKLEAARRARRLARVRRAVEEGVRETLWEEKGYGPAIEFALNKRNSPAPYALAGEILETIRSKMPAAEKSLAGGRS